MKDIKRSMLRWGRTFVENTVGVEIETKRFYPHLKRLHSWSPNDVIFDVGANDGRTILRLHRYLKAPKIYAFEPVATTFHTLVERTASLKNVHCFQSALGARPESKEIYLHDVAAVNSFDPSWGESTGTATVDVSTVDQVMEEHGIDFIHFLKVDTEGHDLEALKGARDALAASRVGIIQVETGVDQTERRYATLEEFCRFLQPQGYFLYGIFNQVRRRALPPATWPVERKRTFHAKTLAYCDAVFVRAELIEPS